MYIPIGPSKKDLYKIILLLICLLFCFRGCVKAEATAPNTLEYNIGPNSTIPTGARSQVRYGFNTYSDTYCNGGTCTYIWSSIYGNAGTNSGKYFTYFMYSENVQYNVVANIQLTSGDYVACQVASNITNNKIINAICDLSSFQNNVSVYKYGFNWQNQDLTYSNSYEISKLYYFNTSVENQQQINNINNNVSNINNGINNINDSINDSSIDSSSANNLTNNSAFQDSNGLDAIIKAPLNFIQSLTSTTCSAISLTIPYIDANVSLPCMSSVYNKALGQQLVNLIALVINGVILYRYCLKILQLVHNAKNPNKDELEVLDL